MQRKSGVVVCWVETDILHWATWHLLAKDPLPSFMTSQTVSQMINIFISLRHYGTTWQKTLSHLPWPVKYFLKLKILFFFWALWHPPGKIHFGIGIGIGIVKNLPRNVNHNVHFAFFSSVTWIVQLYPQEESFLFPTKHLKIEFHFHL